MICRMTPFSDTVTRAAITHQAIDVSPKRLHCQTQGESGQSEPLRIHTHFLAVPNKNCFVIYLPRQEIGDLVSRFVESRVEPGARELPVSADLCQAFTQDLCGFFVCVATEET